MIIDGAKDKESAKRRFWAKVQKGKDCWLWTGARVSDGYGSFAVKHALIRSAHRISWELGNESAIPPGRSVLHECDTPACVNPAHLFLGTQKDNMRDAYRKNRMHRFDNRGSKHGNAKLNEDDVRNIRLARTTGWSNKSLAHIFEVSVSNVEYIVRRKTWTHVD